MKQKFLVVALALTLVLCIAMGATLAWLTIKTDSIKNVFVFGNINITLTETNPVVSDGVGTIKFLPGQEVAKDPVVTVKAGSEKCWLFIKVDAVELTGRINYAVNDTNWEAVPDHAGWYYAEVEATAVDQTYYILSDIDGNDIADYEDANGTIKCADLTKEQVDALAQTELSLTFTAFAIQYDAAANVADAWTLANGLLPQNP